MTTGGVSARRAAHSHRTSLRARLAAWLNPAPPVDDGSDERHLNDRWRPRGWRITVAWVAERADAEWLGADTIYAPSAAELERRLSTAPRGFLDATPAELGRRAAALNRPYVSDGPWPR